MHAEHDFLTHETEDDRIALSGESPSTHLDAFDDAEIELALKSVCWTPRDVHQFLRHRASR